VSTRSTKETFSITVTVQMRSENCMKYILLKILNAKRMVGLEPGLTLSGAFHTDA
jgi:hypothetical protein